MGGDVGVWTDPRRAMIASVTNKGEQLGWVISRAARQVRRTGDWLKNCLVRANMDARFLRVVKADTMTERPPAKKVHGLSGGGRPPLRRPARPRVKGALHA